MKVINIVAIDGVIRISTEEFKRVVEDIKENTINDFVKHLKKCIAEMEPGNKLRSDLGFAKDSPKLTDEELNDLLSCVSPNEIDSSEERKMSDCKMYKEGVGMDYNSLVHQVCLQKSIAESRTMIAPDEIILGCDVFDFLLTNCPLEIKYFYGKETSYRQFFGLRVYVDSENKDRVYVVPKMQY